MTTDGTVSTTGGPSARAPWVALAASSVLVIVGALAVGGLTSLGQQYLPVWLTSLANSAGGWAMLAFALVWLSRTRPIPGAILGAVAFLLMVEGYGVVSAWRGFFYADPFSSIWTGRSRRRPGARGVGRDRPPRFAPLVRSRGRAAVGRAPR